MTWQVSARRRSRPPRVGRTRCGELDFSQYETVAGGTWQIAGCRDYWSKYEFAYHLSPTANQHDAIAALEAAIAEASGHARHNAAGVGHRS